MIHAARIVLLVLFSSSFVNAMQQNTLPEAPLAATPLPQKIHLRVIANDLATADWFFDCVKKRRDRLIDFWFAQGLAKKEVEKVIKEYVSVEFSSDCGLMVALVGDRGFIEKGIADLRVAGFSCMAHDQEANRERYVFTNSPLFLAASADLNARRKSTKASLSRKRSRQEEVYDTEPLMACVKRQKKESEKNSPTSVVPPLTDASAIQGTKKKPCLKVATPNAYAGEGISVFYKRK